MKKSLTKVLTCGIFRLTVKEMKRLDLKQMLEKRRITVTEIAKALGVSRTFVSLVIHGHKKSKRVTSYIEEISQRGKTTED